MPFGRRKDAFVSRLDDEVRDAMSSARFAAELTALDRVAPSNALKRVSFWDVVHMRLPVGWWWNREHDDGTGMFVASDPTIEDGPSLWVDFDQFDSLDAGSTAADYADHVNELTAQLAAAGADTQKLVTEQLARYDTAVFYCHEDVRNGQQLHYDYCHRIVLRDRFLVVAHFSIIRPHGRADAEGSAALLRREIRNAWIVPA